MKRFVVTYKRCVLQRFCDGQRSGGLIFMSLRYASATKEERKEKQASGPQPSEANADHFDTLPQRKKNGKRSRQVVLSRAKRTPTTSIRFCNKLNIYIHYMEAYRSGHNGPHSKCGYRPKRYKGSNPFASASSAHPSKVAQPKKGLDKNGHAFFCWLLYPTGYAARLQLREDEMT